MFTRKKIIISGILIVAVGGFLSYRSRTAVEVVQTETVKRGDVVETVSVTGELMPAEYADLSFPGAGVIDRVFVKEGDMVAVGGRIASLDRSVLWSQLKESRIALAIVEESEKLARRHGWKSLNEEERAAKKLTTEQSKEKVRTIEAEMQKGVLLSPLGGQVTKLDARLGEVASLGEVVAHVVKAGEFVIEARVPESDITKITIGMRSKVTFDAFRADEIFDAEVTEIKPASTVVQDVVSYKVKFRLGNVDSRLKEGMTANIDIETAKRERVLMVPSRVFVKEGGKSFVEVKQANGSFVKTEVTTGLEGDDGTIEITSGLKEGNEVSTLATQKK
ncbi:MAG: efflux RND transporter periplasmic adaptor subunit [Candidatus Moranbacteria bacterium]|nr:efflux RND transporter periplasmic adaptor subunit [Candidatus Moranbacteria bacterium]